MKLLRVINQHINISYKDLMTQAILVALLEDLVAFSKNWVVSRPDVAIGYETFSPVAPLPSIRFSSLYCANKDSDFFLIWPIPCQSK